MFLRKNVDSMKNVCRREVPYRDVYDQALFDEALYSEYPEQQYGAVSEGMDASDIYHHISRVLPPEHIKPQELTEAQELSKLGASSAKKGG